MQESPENDHERDDEVDCVDETLSEYLKYIETDAKAPE